MSLVALGDVINTQKGYPFKSKWFIKKGVPVLKVKDFTKDSISDKNLVFVSNEVASKFIRYEVQPSDIIIQTVGSWASNPNSVVGKVVKVPKNLTGALLNQNAVKILPSQSVYGNYLFYVLRNDLFKSYIINTAQGSASQANITLKSIKGYKFNLPSLETQKKIADILSNYDDLIENNLKRINLLEQAAQNIYKEWFVNMRFPDYENTPINQETGLPYNWKKEKIGNILKLIHGFAFKAKDFVNEPTNIMVIRMGNFNEYGDLQLDKNVKYLPSGTEIKERYKLFAGDLLMVLSDVTRDGRIIGNVGILPQKEITYALNQRVANLKLQEPKLKYYFLYSLNSYHFKEYCKSRANGATVLNLKTTDVLNYEITIPSKKLIDLFLNQVTPINQLKENLLTEIEKLKSTRDILLPRLMNQTIEV